jgi:hypothetical protein
MLFEIVLPFRTGSLNHKQKAPAKSNEVDGLRGIEVGGGSLPA